MQPDTAPDSSLAAIADDAGPARPSGSDFKRRKVIEPSRRWQTVDFSELWRFRELLYFFVWRDIRVRYNQTVLGAAWAVIQPVTTMIVFSIFFGHFGGMSRNVDVPYPVFVFAALVPWTFFSSAVAQTSQSLLNNSNLITKVYFPRLIIPASAVGGVMLDFFVALGVLLLMTLFYRLPLQLSMLLIPLYVVGTTMAAIGFGTLMSAVMVAYRDFRHVSAFLLQLWMFASPIAYPLSVIPEEYRLLYAINPMAGMISGFRSSILGLPTEWGIIGVSFVSAAALLCLGLYYFRVCERRFADII